MGLIHFACELPRARLAIPYDPPGYTTSTLRIAPGVWFTICTVMPEERQELKSATASRQVAAAIRGALGMFFASDENMQNYFLSIILALNTTPGWPLCSFRGNMIRFQARLDLVSGKWGTPRKLRSM